MFFLICGILGIAFGALLTYTRIDRLKNAQPYIAKLVNIESKWVKTGAAVRKVYRAVVSYHGRIIDQRAHQHEYVYYNDHVGRFGLGEEFTVYIDPRVSDVFYFPSEMRGKVSFGALAAFLIGLFFVIVGIIFISRGM